MVRVVLVDDHKVMRAGLKALLESTGQVQVVGEASSGEEAVERVRTLEPDIAVMDLAMPGMDGVRATRRIRDLGMETKVLVLTVHDEDEFLIPAMNAGAAGFLTKTAADTELTGAIEALVHGHSYLPLRAASLLDARARGAARGKVGPEVLSERERTVVGLYARGLHGDGSGQEGVPEPQDRRGLRQPCQDQAGPEKPARHRAVRAGDRSPARGRPIGGRGLGPPVASLRLHPAARITPSASRSTETAQSLPMCIENRLGGCAAADAGCQDHAPRLHTALVA